MSVHDIIRYPHITEKSTLRSEQSGDSQVVTFKVRTDASKHQIREAVESIFNVKVDQISLPDVKVPSFSCPSKISTVLSAGAEIRIVGVLLLVVRSLP